MARNGKQPCAYSKCFGVVVVSDRQRLLSPPATTEQHNQHCTPNMGGAVRLSMRTAQFELQVLVHENNNHTTARATAGCLCYVVMSCTEEPWRYSKASVLSRREGGSLIITR
jgi:hypothetical protein